MNKSESLWQQSHCCIEFNVSFLLSTSKAEVHIKIQSTVNNKPQLQAIIDQTAELDNTYVEVLYYYTIIKILILKMLNALRWLCFDLVLNKEKWME